MGLVPVRTADPEPEDEKTRDGRDMWSHVTRLYWEAWMERGCVSDGRRMRLDGLVDGLRMIDD